MPREGRQARPILRCDATLTMLSLPSETSAATSCGPNEMPAIEAKCGNQWPPSQHPRASASASKRTSASASRARPRSSNKHQASPSAQQADQRQRQQADQRQQGSPPVQQETPRQRQRQEAPRQRESVRAAVKREVWQRDGARCTYVDGRTRCRETAFLQLHHVNPHAKGGPPSAANLTLRCHAHNALAAEQDFGRDFVRAKRDARGRGKVRSSVAPK